MTISSTAQGGNGGQGTGTGNSGGTGGIATAFANGTGEGGGAVTIISNMTGGNGGEGLGGANGGTGASEQVGNSQGNGPGLITLSQSATGGSGGNTDSTTGTSGGWGGNATLLLNNTDSEGPMSVTASAIGGNGGSSVAGTGGLAGMAQAENNVTALNFASATSTAIGGLGGEGATSSQMDGMATSMANATVTNSGGTAMAQASGAGPGGLCSAEVTALGDGNSNISSLGGAANGESGPLPSNVVTVLTQVSDGGALPGRTLASLPSGTSAAAYASAFPQSADVTALQGGNSNNQATFGPGGSSTVIAVGMFGAINTTGTAQDINNSLQFTLTKVPASLKLGLLDPTSSGNGFTSLTFTVTDSSQSISQTFATIAAANLYFNDNVLTLTGNSTTIGLQYDETFTSEGDGYAVDFELGESAVPEPSIWAMLLGGFGLLAFWRIQAPNAIRNARTVLDQF